MSSKRTGMYHRKGEYLLWEHNMMIGKIKGMINNIKLHEQSFQQVYEAMIGVAMKDATQLKT